MDCPENSQYSLCTSQTSQTCATLDETFSTICAEGEKQRLFSYG